MYLKLNTTHSEISNDGTRNFRGICDSPVVEERTIHRDQSAGLVINTERERETRAVPCRLGKQDAKWQLSRRY